MSRYDGLAREGAVNDVCPWSGDPISANALTRYRGEIVGFCNPGCRDKFERAASTFDRLIDARGSAHTIDARRD